MRGGGGDEGSASSTTATTSTKSAQSRENIRPGAFQPVENLLEGFEGDALLAILQAKEA